MKWPSRNRWALYLEAEIQDEQGHFVGWFGSKRAACTEADRLARQNPLRLYRVSDRYGLREGYTARYIPTAIGRREDALLDSLIKGAEL